MTGMPEQVPDQLTDAMPGRDELRELFLFADLADDQLDWIIGHAELVTVDAGQVLARESDRADYFYVLLSGALVLTRTVGGDEVEIARTDQRGVYMGAVQFYLGDQVDQLYPGTTRATSRSVFLALRAVEFIEVFRAWYPMAVHLLQGMFVGQRNTSAIVGQRERLLALGKLTAGLTHELNNPAAAANRAAQALGERVGGMRRKLAALAAGDIDRERLQLLVTCQEAFVQRAADAPELSPLEAADAEDAVADWLDEHGVAQGWELAPVFVAAGLGEPDLDSVAAAADDGLDGALRWLAYTLETEALVREITESTTRVSALVAAARQYSQLDRAPHQWFTVHEGLKATLVMFGPKLAGVRVVKELDPELPQVPGYPAELNQVWSNLIDNALDAMDGAGQLTIRSRREHDHAVVEIADTGPGIPAELRQRIFEPFFTTKPVGRGTGLGLDVSYRVVVTRHHGDLRVTSRPGETVFTVRLPLTESAPGEPRLRPG